MSQPHPNSSDNECEWFANDPDRMTPDVGFDSSGDECEWFPEDPDGLTPDVGENNMDQANMVQPPPNSRVSLAQNDQLLSTPPPPTKRARIDAFGAGEDDIDEIAQLHNVAPPVVPAVQPVVQPGVQPINQGPPQGHVNQVLQQGNVNNNNNTLTFAIDGRVVYHSKKFNVDGVDFKVKILTPPRNTPYREVMDAVAQLLERIFNARMRLDDVRPSDKIRFAIISPELTKNISTAYQKRSEVTPQWFADFVCSKLQSHESLDLNNGFYVHIQTVKLDQGHTAIRVTRGLALDKRIEKSRAVFSNVNKDVADLPCFILSLYLFLNCKPGDHCNQSEFRKLLKQTPKVRRGIFEIMDKMGLTMDYKTTDVTEFHAFQKYITEHCDPNINLNVIKSNSFGDLLYRGGPDSAKNNIVIMLHEERFLPVLKLSLWLEKEAYCFTCQKTVDLKLHRLTPEGTCHRGESGQCTANCSKCLQKSCFGEKLLTKFCDKCFGHFRNTLCFDNHKQFDLCDPKNICGKCFKWKPSTVNHKCNPLVKCSACGKVAGIDHVCFIQVNKKKSTDKFRYVFYDFECAHRQASLGTGNRQSHHVNLCVAAAYCSECTDIPCKDCKDFYIFEKTREKPNPLQDFCSWCFDDPINQDATFIAHNASGYDAHFVIACLIGNGRKPDIVVNGNQIIELKYQGRRFIDSLRFLTMPLDAFPKTFGIPNAAKGYFPHLFNTPENFEYFGPLPAQEYYAPDEMKTKAKTGFMQWYQVESAKGELFVFKQQLLEYCKIDVNILRIGCIAFRKAFMTATSGIDPFEKCTIASACMAAYCKSFMPPQTIARIPAEGYPWSPNHSLAAMSWLTYLELEGGVPNLQHAWNFGEYRIPECGLYADGYDKVTHTVYSFAGCLFHGCKDCFPRSKFLQKLGTSAGDAREAYTVWCKRIQCYGYKVVTMWECKWQKERGENPKVRAHDQMMRLTEPMNIRDTLYGGRTEVFTTTAQGTEAEPIHYTDITSLYPYVCRNKRFPIGHPIRLCGPGLQRSNPRLEYFEGAIKCKVLPPTNLKIPLLPYRCNGKLTFPLCARCVKKGEVGECECTQDQRALVGTWLTPELKEAECIGYKILEFYEVLHYECTSQYDPETGKGGIMSSYVNQFMKLKLEASGYPPNVQSELHKQQYIRFIRENEHIELDPKKIEYNPGMRATAKIILNSHWGKFSQRPDKGSKKFVNTNKEFLEIITSPKNEIREIMHINDDVLFVGYKPATGHAEASPTSNVIIGAYVTTYGRLELYKYLSRLGENALYCDTDSVIFKKLPGCYAPQVSSLVGGMTDELDGDYITEFISNGPKNYAYKTSSGLECIKVKGFRFSDKVANQLTFEKLKEIAHTDQQTVLQVNDNVRFVKELNSLQVCTVTGGTKSYRKVLDKRRFDKDGTSIPFGYRGVIGYKSLR